jgi:hypothetical protein
MPYHRDPLSDEEILRIRQWIDDGARDDSSTSREHTIIMDHIVVNDHNHAFWLSCRAPKNEQNIGLRVKVIDEATGEVVNYDWPTEGEQDYNGRWNQWHIDIAPSSMKFPGTVSVNLEVSHGWPTGSAESDVAELNGVIFLLEPTQTGRCSETEYSSRQSNRIQIYT